MIRQVNNIQKSIGDIYSAKPIFENLVFVGCLILFLYGNVR